MHQNSRNIFPVNYFSSLNRYSFICQNRYKDEQYKVLSTSFFPINQSEKKIRSVYIVPRPFNQKLPFLAQWLEYETGELVFIDFPHAVEHMMRTFISSESADLHDLCAFKIDQLPGVYSQNDLRMELMTKKFQPHLICIYPVLNNNHGSDFVFGHPSDNWMFDPLIDALSYRRSSQKATLIFFILNQSVEQITLAAGDEQSDTVKILQEGIRSGLEVATPKIISMPGEEMNISFQKRFQIL